MPDPKLPILPYDLTPTAARGALDRVGRLRAHEVGPHLVDYEFLGAVLGEARAMHVHAFRYCDALADLERVCSSFWSSMGDNGNRSIIYRSSLPAWNQGRDEALGVATTPSHAERRRDEWFEQTGRVPAESQRQLPRLSTEPTVRLVARGG